MKLKKFSALSSALILALASLFSLAFGGIAHAAGTTLYWCEFSTNSDFNTASNWNTNSDCSSGTQEVPVSGDSLVFDNSHLNSAININNDISGLDISSITFQGSGNAGYVLGGDGISIDNGITDSGSNSITNNINLNLTLTSGQTFGNSNGNDSLFFNGTINLGTFNLTVSANPYGFDLSSLTGSGGLTFDGDNDGGIDYYNIVDSNTPLTGPVTIDNYAAVTDSSDSLNGLGTGTITINNGGSLMLSSPSDTGTLSNNLNLNGSGDGIYDFGALISNLALSSNTDTVLTLSGNVTLDGNTKVVNSLYSSGQSSPPSYSATFNFTGNVTYNGYTLAAYDPSASNTIVGFNLPATGGSGSSKTAPKSPDTGLGLISSHSWASLLGVALLIVALVIPTVVFRKINKSTKS